MGDPRSPLVTFANLCRVLLCWMYRYTLFYCILLYCTSQMLPLLKKKIEGKALHQQRDYDLLYCGLLLQWSGTKLTKNVHLYLVSCYPRSSPMGRAGAVTPFHLDEGQGLCGGEGVTQSQSAGEGRAAAAGLRALLLPCFHTAFQAPHPTVPQSTYL